MRGKPDSNTLILEVQLPAEVRPERLVYIIEGIIDGAKATIKTGAIGKSDSQSRQERSDPETAAAIAQLLRQYGPQSSEQLYAMVSESFPDLNALRLFAKDLVKAGQLVEKPIPMTKDTLLSLPV